MCAEIETLCNGKSVKNDLLVAVYCTRLLNIIMLCLYTKIDAKLQNMMDVHVNTETALTDITIVSQK